MRRATEAIMEMSMEMAAELTTAVRAAEVTIEHPPSEVEDRLEAQPGRSHRVVSLR